MWIIPKNSVLLGILFVLAFFTGNCLNGEFTLQPGDDESTEDLI